MDWEIQANVLSIYVRFQCNPKDISPSFFLHYIELDKSI